VRAGAASGAHPVVVVTGHEAERVAEALHALPVKLVHNPNFGEGLSTSLRAGLAALPSDADGALILLGDMPFIEAGDLKALIAALSAKGSQAICVPVCDGRRGNPVLWGAAYFPAMTQLSGDAGAKRLIGEHEAYVVEVPVSSNAIFTDLDTLEDLARVQTRVRETRG
jgi:molybdenum cofactor cytidylyltransferase